MLKSVLLWEKSLKNSGVAADKESNLFTLHSSFILHTRTLTMMEDLSPPPPTTTRTPPLSSCPFQLLKKQAEQNSSRIKKKKKEDAGGEDLILIDDEDVINAFVLFNQDLANRDKCINKVQKKGSLKECNCLQILHLNTPFCAAVGEYQSFFAGHKREDQQKMAIDWMRTCEGNRHSAPKNSPLYYPIPFLVQPPSEDEEVIIDYGPLSRTNICRDALMDLIGVSIGCWTTVTSHCRNHTMPSHKLKGRLPNNKRKWNDLFESDLMIDHFEELRKESGPIATRFVQEQTGELSERDTNDEAEYLSPH